MDCLLTCLIMPLLLIFLSLYVPDEEIEKFVYQTNLYAEQCIETRPNAGPTSVFKLWKPVNLLDMKAFLALTINMGLVWKPEIKDYWSTDLLFHTPFWGKYIARDRYLAILAFFHLLDNFDVE